MRTYLITATLAGLFTLASCSQSDDVVQDDSTLSILKVEEDGTSMMTRANITPVMEATSPLTADETEFLYAIREDEKIAHDVYAAFSALYPAAKTISKIMTAESSHISAAEAVLDYYEIEYPPLSDTGIFEDADRQALYNDLITKGTTLIKAYGTMALMEEETVYAYKSIQNQLTNSNLSLLLSQLIKASSNHLRATVRQVVKLGGSYSPAYLSDEEYQTIINMAFENGNFYGIRKHNGEGNTNAQKKGNKKGIKGAVDRTGTCTSTSNGSLPATNSNKGVGKGYRGGKK